MNIIKNFFKKVLPFLVTFPILASNVNTDIQEMNEIMGMGVNWIHILQYFIVIMVILIFIINVAMEAGKERPDIAGILQKLMWAAAIGGTAFIVVELIFSVWGANINPSLLIC